MKKVVVFSLVCSFLLLSSMQVMASGEKSLRDLILEKIEKLKPAPGETAPTKPTVKPKPQKPMKAPQTKLEDSRFSVKVWADKTSYRPGETATISFQVNRESYVTIYDIGSSGRATILFPNKMANDNHVEANTIYTVPAKGDKFKYVVGGPPGKDLILAVATLQNIDLTKKVAKEKVGPFKKLVGSFKKIFTRDISVVFEDASEKAEGTKKVVGKSEPQKPSPPLKGKQEKEKVTASKKKDTESKAEQEKAKLFASMEQQKIPFGDWAMNYTELAILAGKK